MLRPAATSGAGDRDGIGRGPAWAIVALLAVLHAAPFLVTFVEGDFARDLDRATGIVEGGPWPMRGPVLAWTLHLGPVWYWLLALPLAAFHSIAAAVAMVAVLSALQFPLAYRLGEESRGRAFGLAFATFLALPGLGALESTWIAHPSLVPTTMLLVAWCAWRAWTRASPGWWIAAMLASSLALHAHPTTLPVLVLPLVAAPRALRADGRVAVTAIAAGVAAFLAPFAPLALDFAVNAGELARFATGVSSDVARFSPGRWLDAFAALAWRVPDAVGGMTLAGRPGAPVAFRLALAALYAMALAGGVLALAGRASGWLRLLVAALAALALVIAMSVAVRETTRFYMLYAALPPFAAWLAACTAAWGARTVSILPLRVAPVALGLALSVATSGAWLLRASGGEIRVPATLSASADLSGSVPRGYTELLTLTPADLDALGRRVCAAGSVRAFGELAGVLDMLVNVPGRLACGERSRVVLGGQGDGIAIYMIAADAVPSTAVRERHSAFATGRVDEVFAPALPVPLAERVSYPWRAACGAPVPVTYRVATRGAGALVVSNALAATCPMTVRRIARDGADVPTLERADSRIAAMPEGEAVFDIAVETGDARAVQVFAIAARPGGG